MKVYNIGEAKSSLFSPSPLRKQRSNVVKRSLMRKKSNVSQNDIQKAKSNESTYIPKPNALESRSLSITKSRGLGSRRNIIDIRFVNDGSNTVNTNTGQSNKENDENNCKYIQDPEDDWEVINGGNDTSCMGLCTMFTKSDEDEENAKEKSGTVLDHAVYVKDTTKENKEVNYTVDVKDTAKEKEEVETIRILHLCANPRSVDWQENNQSEKKATEELRQASNTDDSSSHGKSTTEDSGIATTVNKGKSSDGNNGLLQKVDEEDDSDAESLIDVASEAADRSLTIIGSRSSRSLTYAATSIGNVSGTLLDAAADAADNTLSTVGDTFKIGFHRIFSQSNK